LCSFGCGDRRGITVKQLDRLVDVKIHARIHDALNRLKKGEEEAEQCQQEGATKALSRLFAGEGEYPVTQHARPWGVFAATGVVCCDLPRCS
jgi:hypothetical protein